jgi:hypothetical protein
MVACRAHFLVGFCCSEASRLQHLLIHLPLGRALGNEIIVPCPANALLSHRENSTHIHTLKQNTPVEMNAQSNQDKGTCQTLKKESTKEKRIEIHWTNRF